MKQNIIRGILGAGIVVICVIIGAGILAEQPSETENGTGMQVFTSASGLAAYLDSMPQGENGYSTGFMGIMDGNTRVVYEEASLDNAMTPVPVPAQLPQALKSASSGSGGAEVYSSTNVQVGGVDEADFIKNDGKYIYLVTGGRLVIVDAYPPLGAGIISETPLSGTPSALFLSGDRLAVFSSVRETDFIHPDKSVAPVPYARDVTHVYVYDISDRKEPKIIRDLTVAGTYYDGRMKGDDVFLFTRESLVRHGDVLLMPEVRDGDTLIAQPPVSVPDMPGYSFQFTTITSFDIRDGSVTDAESFLLGYGSTLYASVDNIYIAYIWQQPYSGGVWDRFGQAPAEPREQSVVHRFSVEKGEISYAATGTFPGRLLNQFSLDEYKGNLRVATTVNDWTRDTWVQYNNVYVLDSGLTMKGKLEYLAPDERIYAARFIGDRLYLVTFKQMDPFFVIDLTDPTTPAVLGELKIPGYSDYLHPYDATHIIGIGKETVANEWGGFTTGGLKMALFDVADVNHPKEVGKVEIGLPGTDSEALHDHKAFLFDASRNILVLPVHEIVKVPVTGSPYDAYSTRYWQGAYVYSLTPETGFVLKGTVTHNADPQSGYYWGAPDSVLRSLYMDDVLYTVSRTKLVISGLEHPETVYGAISLPYGGERYGGGYWPVPEPLFD
ncbi:beta-propeller domain-containing protein [Methanogenium sp. S4BF]|uniref:beta-propeller domain-containing protein n=1 Tax=Methanogenium sp. S4BF TaxID=1789226 RepID=UPI002415C533|nr:beta-propeller domain-containing protein [Methanogenium sp. S4BF]WFN35079.1 beta-propeller domain-containing protein [Methanogenium sp. S4BF]